MVVMHWHYIQSKGCSQEGFSLVSLQGELESDFTSVVSLLSFRFILPPLLPLLPLLSSPPP